MFMVISPLYIKCFSIFLKDLKYFFFKETVINVCYSILCVGLVLAYII